MESFDDLQKNRTLISKMLNKQTKGEITDFDFFVDYLNIKKGHITFMFAVPAKVKKEYNMDVDAIIAKHFDTIKRILSVAGFPSIMNRSYQYVVL